MRSSPGGASRARCWQRRWPLILVPALALLHWKVRGAVLAQTAVAAVMLGAAEGCLLQSATQGGAVPPGELVKALMSLALSGA